ncbi:MAG TPA: alpha-amylase family glycosyl hydrolase [Pseudonocardiaceae bacterium]|nr:alpha-amylase family glycosyl hydrolase [Pseudonocardiaceae bacterium]
MRLTHTSDLWGKNAVFYRLDVETYQDSDGDGHGDFRGLIQRIDHLQRLGVTCVWLMPYYPSPDRDDGYDITDYYGVDARLGNHGDLVEFVRTARDRGIRVIADLVVNPTSDQHPWFQSARSSADSPYRDWYVWADEPPADGPQGIAFPDQETSVWTYDEVAGQYYLHRFYKCQPDLNVANPEVRDEIARTIGFGLSGFRVDAVPFLLETTGQDDAGQLPDPHDHLADLRAFLGRRSGEGVLLGEVNLPYPQTMTFFGTERDELTMCFDRIRMVYSLLFSLPGTPVLFYGEEIGMGEDLRAEGRHAVRTPMQWSPEPGGGFSTAEESELPGPIPGGQYGPEQVNVATQERDPESLLSWMRLLIESYRACPELAWGRHAALDADDAAVLAHRCDTEDGTIVAVHNFGADPTKTALTLTGMDDSCLLKDVLAGGSERVAKDGSVTLELGRYGCRWLRADYR